MVVWDSGALTNPDVRHVDVDGALLQPDVRYEWSVDVRTAEGSASASSWFHRGLTHDDQWHGAQWIAGWSDGALLGSQRPAPVLLGRLNLTHAPEDDAARLYVAAGGHTAVRINGKDADLGAVVPGFTDYDVRVQYVAAHVGRLLRRGDNIVSLELGRGFYGPLARSTWDWHIAPWHGEPTARCMLVVDTTHGPTRLVTDDSWEVVDGGTLRDDPFAGEDYDAAADRTLWPESSERPERRRPAVVVAGPRGRLEHQRQQPQRVIDRIPPDRIERTAPDVLLAHYPRLVSGWVEVAPPGDQPSRLRLDYGERLTAARTPDNLDTHGYFDGRFQVDEVAFPAVAADNVRDWHPRFGYRGFSWVQVTGWPEERGAGLPAPEKLSALVVHNDVASRAEFTCSEPSLVELHALVRRTILVNLHDLPTDTPTYEKNGWTGDGMLGAEMMLRNFDTQQLLAKWLDDIADTTRHTGLPAVIAPHGGWRADWTPTPTWNAAFPLLAWWLRVYGGDDRPMLRHYDALLRHARLEHDRTDGGIATTTLGDWVSPEADPGGGNPPEDLRVAATAYVYRILRTVMRIALVLGRRDDARELSGRARDVRDAFRRTFVSATGAVRGADEETFRQTHQVLALRFGLVPRSLQARTAAGLAADVRARGDHLNTGALGTKYLLPVLSRHGYAREALSVAVNPTYPGWGHWLQHGATTLWEHWAPESRSRGHYFLGTVDDWLFEDVAGIRPASPGWRTFDVAPTLTHLLDHAAARLQTPLGDAAVSWYHEGRRVVLEVEVPVGAVARLRVPGADGRRLGPGRHRLELAGPSG